MRDSGVGDVGSKGKGGGKELGEEGGVNEKGKGGEEGRVEGGIV